MDSWPTAAEFDDWYADMADSPATDLIHQRHLGLPPDLMSSSALGWQGINEVEQALCLTPGEILLDLACGRGGYGIEIAMRTGAALIGVDFSAEAVRQATRQAHRLDRAIFHVGDLEATGLDDASVDAVVCVDSIQFAQHPDATFREVRRVLVPGGRVVMTCWEALDRQDDRLPERIRRVDLSAGLTEAGFVDVDVRDRPGWREAERAMWLEAVAIQPGDDPGLQSLNEEGQAVLKVFDHMRRVIATARR